MSKRPRGLWKSQRSTASNSDPYITDIHIDSLSEQASLLDSNHVTNSLNPSNWANIQNPTKKRRISPFVERSTSPSSHSPPQPRHQAQSPPQWDRLDRLDKFEQPTVDVESWEDVKELFVQAVEKYEAEAPDEAVELFRRVIHESDHLLRLYPDPTILLSNGRDSRITSWLIQQQGTTFSFLRQPASDPGHHSHASRDFRDLKYPRDQKDPRELRDSRDPIRINDPPTTFHYVYGTSMLLLGKILEAYPGLAKDVEPVNTPAFYLAALDVLEDGENSCHSIKNSRFPKEDWRLAFTWGRTLVCLAEEKIRRMNKNKNQDQNQQNGVYVNGHKNHAQTPVVNFGDDLWPKDSAFAPAFSKRPPLTRKVSLPSMTPHEILLQATDQFSRAMLHMPRLKRVPSDQKFNHGSTSDATEMMDATDTTDTESNASPKSFGHELDAPPTLPGLGTPLPYGGTNNANGNVNRIYGLVHGYGLDSSRTTPTGNADANVWGHWNRWRRSPGYIRPRMLFAISYDILSIADRMPNAYEREYWAKWADDVFMQMEMGQISQQNHSGRMNHGNRASNMAHKHDIDHTGNMNGTSPAYGQEDWTYAISAGRARCWLIIGATRFEAIEDQLEQGTPLLSSQQAENARIALRRAVEYFERARSSKNKNSICLPEADQPPPMLAEAFVTLATLTPPGHLKEHLFARAAAEGVDVDQDDEAMAEAS